MVDCICCWIHFDETNHSNHIRQKGGKLDYGSVEARVEKVTDCTRGKKLENDRIFVNIRVR